MTLELPNLGREPVLVAYAGVLGAMIGSFLNVCILRWGAEPKQSVVRPPSRCPNCGRGLRWFENVPIVGWLALRGRCGGCRERISPQYPLIELGTAVLWAFMAWRHGFGIEALRGAAFATLLLGIAMTDARAYIIPHEFSIGGAVIALGFAVVSNGVPVTLPDALLGAGFGAGLVLLIGEISELVAGQEAMGGGDCALMGMVGAFCGWEAIIPVVGAGAGISVVLFIIATLRPRVPAEDSGAVSGAPGLRLGMLVKLLLAGGLAIAAMAAAMRLGLFGAVLRAAFDGVLAAGAIYYASFLLPSAVEGRWLRVVGLLAAAVGIAAGAGFSPMRLVAGVLLASASVWSARRVVIVESPETAEALSDAGYLPFGVGLSLAAGLLAVLGAYPGIRTATAEFLQLAGVR
ncbi:MAG: prepilin peptidase [Gemmatimonadota bacterium]|nr:prepilin peptidase [Gemmatimonadota bacterium]